jgi:hypothetical protein
VENGNENELETQLGLCCCHCVYKQQQIAAKQQRKANAKNYNPNA